MREIMRVGTDFYVLVSVDFDNGPCIEVDLQDCEFWTVDGHRQEETLVRQVLKLHALPNRRVAKEHSATARFSTSSSVR